MRGDRVERIQRIQRSNYNSKIDRSPRRDINHELDDHSNRIKELLRADLIMLEEQNAILKSKCKKVGELEDKVEAILKQNSQLLAENQRLSKLLHQKKQQYEIIKDKLQVQSSQKMEYAAEFDYERKKLMNQLDQLENELKDIEHIKNAQLNEAKTQYQLEIQAIKRQSASTQEIYDQEIRKLREQLDKRQYELSDAVNRYKRFSSEAQYDIIRLKEEKQKLRNELIYVQSDRKNEIENIRAKLQNNYLQEIQSIKKGHLASLEGFQMQNIKLKDLVENRRIQIDQLNSKLSKFKNSYQDAITVTKRENDLLRNKMVEYQRMSESQKDTLKVKLSKVHEQQIEQMRINHQKYIQCLQNQILKFESSIGKKNAEIQQLIKEKSAVRQMFDSQGNRLKQQIDTLQYKIKDTENKMKDAVANCQEKIRQKNKHIDYLDKLSQDQLQNHQNQVSSLRQIIDHQKNDLESQKMKSRQKDQQNQQTIDDLKAENVTLRQNWYKQKSEKDKCVEDLQYELQAIIANLKTKCDSLTSRNSILQRELTSLKQTIAYKDKQIKNLQERVKISDERQKKLERQNDDLRSKLIKKDQKTNEMLAEQKQRLQTTFAFTLDNLKIDHESAMKLQANKQADFNEKLRKKENQLEDLLRLYKKMRDEMEVLTEQEANKKQMTLKFPGATADLIATKNLFDVFLKSKVLDVCGDVKGKQNLIKK